MISRILTHPGSAHKDEFLACCVLLARHPVPIVRREPTQADLDSLETVVVDVGGEHSPARLNFDHHQFPADAPPLCAISLVLQYFDLYEDAREFCDWLEPTERFDTRGPIETAAWLGLDRKVLFRLSSPIDGTLLRRFSSQQELKPGEPIWEIMRYVGEDLLEYLNSLRERLNFIEKNAFLWKFENHQIIFLPRTENQPNDPGASLARYIDTLPEAPTIIGTVYPDRRGNGFGLSRHNDSSLLDFTRIADQPDVHFAHARGFVAKTSATSQERLRELLQLAYLG